MLPQALDQLDRILAHQQSPPSMFVDAVKFFQLSLFPLDLAVMASAAKERDDRTQA